jgi:hypothetical protein
MAKLPPVAALAGALKIATIMDLRTRKAVDHDVNFMIDAILAARSWSATSEARPWRRDRGAG